MCEVVGVHDLKSRFPRCNPHVLSHYHHSECSRFSKFEGCLCEGRIVTDVNKGDVAFLQAQIIYTEFDLSSQCWFDRARLTQ